MERRTPVSAPVDPELLHDLRMARELQQGLLSQSLPKLRGWEIAAASLPATAVGGDLYDVMALASTLYGFMIADVAGHGMAAALGMAVARTLFRQYARQGNPPASTLATLNGALVHELPQGMVTMAYVQADTLTGNLCIANAGHMFPVVIGQDVREIEIAGLPLGIDPDYHYREINARLQPGETLVLYTDGVTEAGQGSGQRYGYDRLDTLLQCHRAERPRTLLRTVMDAILAWGDKRLADDVTVVVIRRRLTDLNAELRGVCHDVLGEESARALWMEVAHLPPNPYLWLGQLSQIGRTVQARHSGDLSRLLIQHLRLTLDEYRTDLAPNQVGQP